MGPALSISSPTAWQSRAAPCRQSHRRIRPALIRKPFGQIILAAPDVDSGTFRGLAAAYPSVAVRTTLYVSSGDLAVTGSRLLHGASRVGFTPPIVIVEVIDTVSAKNVNITRLSHGCVACSRPVLVDIHDLIKHGSAPDDRAALRRRTGDTGHPF
jgi:esterase/lipase superfamily enzyme